MPDNERPRARRNSLLAPPSPTETAPLASVKNISAAKETSIAESRKRKTHRPSAIPPRR
jgi:hypothetical protein